MLIDERPKHHCATCGKGPLGLAYVTQEELPGRYCNSTCLGEAYFKNCVSKRWQDCGHAACEVCIANRPKLTGEKMTDTKFVEESVEIEVKVKPGLLVKKGTDIFIVAHVKQAEVAVNERYCLVNLRTGMGYEAFYTDTLGYWANKMNREGFCVCESVNLPDDVVLF